MKDPLTDDQAREIRERYAAAKGKLSAERLATEYGRSRATICFLLRGQTYKRAGGPIQPRKGRGWNGKAPRPTRVARRVRRREKRTPTFRPEVRFETVYERGDY